MMMTGMGSFCFVSYVPASWVVVAVADVKVARTEATLVAKTVLTMVVQDEVVVSGIHSEAVASAAGKAEVMPKKAATTTAAYDFMLTDVFDSNRGYRL